MANGDGVSIEAQRNSAWTCIPGRLCGGGEYVKTLADEIERLTTENGELDACATDYRHEIDRLKIEHGDMNLANVEYEKQIERLTAEVTDLKHHLHWAEDLLSHFSGDADISDWRRKYRDLTSVSGRQCAAAKLCTDEPGGYSVEEHARDCDTCADSKQCIYGDACKKGPTCKWPHCVTADQRQDTDLQQHKESK